MAGSTPGLATVAPMVIGNQPADRSKGGEIREAISEADDVERAEAQRKPKQRAKFKIRAEARYENRENLPEKKNSPEKQRHPLLAALRQKSVGAA